MKYMGSKRALLGGVLGDVVVEQASGASRFIDLFAGTCAVAHHVAERVPVEVLTVDQQRLSESLSLAILARTAPLDGQALAAEWIKPAEEALESDPLYCVAFPRDSPVSEADVVAARVLCARHPSWLVRHYGGFYFSARQAMALAELHNRLPMDQTTRYVALAALLETASRCAASPGHTAQPFRPTARLLPHIRESWSRDALQVSASIASHYGARHARVRGAAAVGDALAFATTAVGDGDVVFCDPPYSGVQYSRFYHVIEGIARGGWEHVGGAGRAPARESRATSTFSMRQSSAQALRSLVESLGAARASIVFTFPAGAASNGLSGRAVIAALEERFRLDVTVVPNVHSTLGGTDAEFRTGRAPKVLLDELVVVARPR